MPSGTDPVFDVDARQQFDAHVPLTLWVDASRNENLPPQIQVRIALTGWLKAVLLGRSKEARSLMQRVVELQPGAAEVAKGFLEAHDPAEARFASVYVSLWVPSLCPYLPFAEDTTPDLASPLVRSTDRFGRLWSPRRHEITHPLDTEFLTAEQRAAGDREVLQIESARPWQATYLLKETIAWARSHPNDARVPRALHMAVAASRYRETDSETGKYSKRHSSCYTGATQNPNGPRARNTGTNDPVTRQLCDDASIWAVIRIVRNMKSTGFWCGVCGNRRRTYGA